ncbi:MAG: 6-phosphogluconolactonase [Anaerolineales bacterium]|nr:6-phosphogluconolactonase [Anaerolineales bacterium]
MNREAVHPFWGDERCVPPDDADSNYRMARDALRVSIPEENIHRIYGELAPESAAYLQKMNCVLFLEIRRRLI